MTRRERRDRKDADRREGEARFLDGFYAAERDHEDGADVPAMLLTAHEIASSDDDPYYAGRIAYLLRAV